MGLFNDLRKKAADRAKKIQKWKKRIANIKKFVSALPFIIKAIAIAIVAIAGVTVFVWLIESVTAEETPKTVYEELEVENVSELVEIKGNKNDGYYLQFVDDFEDKLDVLIDKLNIQEGLYTLSDADENLLKDMLKAEIVTQFPDLGGKIDEDDENQFQGAVDVRRITPNKDIGEMKNTGAGEKVTLEDLNDNEIQVEDKKIYYENGEALTVTRNAEVYLKGEYNIAGTKTSDDGVTKKSRIVFSNIEGIDNTVDVKKGQVVYYRGNYFSDGKNTYVEVSKGQDGDTMGYIKAISVKSQKDSVGTETEEDDDEIDPGKPTIADENKKYRIAIAAGYNNSDDKGVNYNNELISEELTIQIAEKVEEIFGQYGNITVIQTGSTSENRENVKPEDRVSLTESATPDLNVQIYFSDEGETGVTVDYEYGDGLSQQLAEILANKISEGLDMENKGAVTSSNQVSDAYLEIDSSYNTGYPSVIARGGNIEDDSDREKLQNGGVDKYAQAIVDGCIEYLESSHDEYDEVTAVEKNDTYERINSHIYDMYYVPEGEFQAYIDNGDEKALDVYTLDENYNLITATWSVDGDKITIRENSAMNFRTVLQKVTTPFEYLLFYLIDSENDQFVSEFAKMIQDTEIVMAVKDNVTTTEVNTKIYQCTKILSDEGNQAEQHFGKDWHLTSNETVYTETCSTSVGITYAHTWFMEYEKGAGYNASSLGLDKDEKVDVEKNVKGILQETTTSTDEAGTNGEGYAIDNGVRTTYDVNLKGDIYRYVCSYQTYEKKNITTHTISNTYEEEEAVVSGDESKFVEIFNEHKMENYISDTWLWDIIAENEKTASLLDLTKYLIYEATDVDYDVTEFDFDIFDLSKFEDMGSSMGSLETFKEYLHSWEGNTGISEDGTKYIVGTDGYGNPTVGYGIDIYNGGFLDRFKAAGYDVSIGAQIDVEFVDALEDEEIQSAIQTVESKCAGLNLTIYQKYALVSRIYNCGAGGAFRARDGKTFVEAYKTYWNQEKDDEYGVTTNDAMYSHKLYTTYMSKPNTAGGQYSTGLENRRKSEWILFKTGYYDRINKWCSQTDTGSIVQKAVECHKYLRINGFTYAQAGISIPITGKGKTVDCSSFVSWVLYEAGYKDFAGPQENSRTFNANRWGWQQVSVSEAQPGDILVYSGHVEIMAADAGDRFRVYNCGGNASINASGTAELPESSSSAHTKAQILKILRPSQ